MRGRCVAVCVVLAIPLALRDRGYQRAAVGTALFIIFLDRSGSPPPRHEFSANASPDGR